MLGNIAATSNYHGLLKRSLLSCSSQSGWLSEATNAQSRARDSEKPTSSERLLVQNLLTSFFLSFVRALG